MFTVKRLAFFFLVLLTVAGAAPVAKALDDSERPGSALVFPFFQVGTVTTAEFGSQPVTLFEISVKCPKGATCLDGQDIDIRIEWVCEGFVSSNSPCQENSAILHTTVNGTIFFGAPDSVANGGTGPTPCNPTPQPQEALENCGTVPVPPCGFGYLLALVVSEFGTPIKFDGLTGDAVYRQTKDVAAAYKAIPIQAGPGLSTGSSTVSGLPANELEFNGSNYQGVTGKIIESVRYPFSTATGSVQTTLILLTLNTLSNRVNFDTDVDLNFYDEFEQGTTVSTSLNCWDFIPLHFLGLSNFGTKGLFFSTSAVKVASFGVADTAGNVTLLGLILVEEFDSARTLKRQYFLPLLNDGTFVDADYKL